MAKRVIQRSPLTTFILFVCLPNGLCLQGINKPIAWPSRRWVWGGTKREPNIQWLLCSCKSDGWISQVGASLFAGLKRRAVPTAAIGSVLERILSKYHHEAAVCKLSICIYMMWGCAEAGTMNHSGLPLWRASNSAWRIRETGFKCYSSALSLREHQ